MSHSLALSPRPCSQLLLKMLDVAHQHAMLIGLHLQLSGLYLLRAGLQVRLSEEESCFGPEREHPEPQHYVCEHGAACSFLDSLEPINSAALDPGLEQVASGHSLPYNSH